MLMLYTKLSHLIFYWGKKNCQIYKNEENDCILGKGHVSCQTGYSRVNSNASEG